MNRSLAGAAQPAPLTRPAVMAIEWGFALLLATLVYWPALTLNYSQDDWLVLQHVVTSPGLPRLPLPFWRPIEDWIAWAGLHTAVPIYKPLAVLTLVATAIAAGRLSTRLWDSVFAGRVTALFVLLAPMNAMTVGEVDTISQLQSAFVGVLLLHVVIAAEKPSAWTPWLFALLSGAAIMTKETAFGVAAVPVGLWLLLGVAPRLRPYLGPARWTWALAATVPIAIVLLLRLWLIPQALSNDIDQKYGAKHLHEWLANAALLWGGDLMPVSAAHLMARPSPIGFFDVLGVVTGVALTALLAVVLVRALGRLGASQRRSLLLTAIYLVAAIVPTVIYHASENYVFQVLPFLAIGVGALVARSAPPRIKRISIGVLLAFGALSAHALQINTSLLKLNYGYSEYLRCSAGLAPGCPAAIDTARCLVKPEDFERLRGSPRKDYSLYYSAMDSYFDLTTFPLEAYDARQHVELCGTRLTNDR